VPPSVTRTTCSQILASAHLERANQEQLQYKALRDLAMCMPEVANADVAHMQYTGGRTSSELMERLRERCVA